MTVLTISTCLKGLLNSADAGKLTFRLIFIYFRSMELIGTKGKCLFEYSVFQIFISHSTPYSFL